MGEDYDGLSPEEIKAIESDNEGGDHDPDKDDADGIEKVEGAEEPGDKEAGGVEKEEKEAVTGDGEAVSPKDDSKEGMEGAPKPDKKDTSDAEKDGSSEQRPFTPKFAGGDQDKIDLLKTDLDEAKKKFDEGEIDYAVFNATKDVYNEAKWKADFSQEINANMQDERWSWEQERFFDDNRQFRNNALLNSAFVSAVNTIIASEDGVKLTDREVLMKAEENVNADLRALTGKTESFADKKESAKSKAIIDAKKKQADRSQIPADISGIPAAEENNETPEFAGVDKLSGEAYQTAIEKMTPAQLVRYENS